MIESGNNTPEKWMYNPELVDALKAAFERNRSRPWSQEAVAEYCSLIPEIDLPAYDERNPAWKHLVQLCKTINSDTFFETVTSLQDKLSSGIGRRIMTIIQENQRAIDTDEIVTITQFTKANLTIWAQSKSIPLSDTLNLTDVKQSLRYEVKQGRLITNQRLTDLLQQDELSQETGYKGRAPGQKQNLGKTM